MVKFVVLPVVIVLLAMHTQINALGVVRVDVQKENNGEFANAFGNAISAKIQSIGNILNSLIQIKFGGLTGSTTSDTTTSTTTTAAPKAAETTAPSTTSAPATPSAAPSAPVARSATGIPVYRKVITFNKGYASAAPVRANTVGTYSYPVKRIVWNKSFYPVPVVYTPVTATKTKTLRYTYGK